MWESREVEKMMVDCCKLRVLKTRKGQADRDWWRKDPREGGDCVGDPKLESEKDGGGVGMVVSGIQGWCRQGNCKVK